MNFLWDNIFRRARDESDVQSLLSSNIIFSDLSRKELEFIESLVHVRNYRNGEYIFRQGEVGVGMYLIMSGYVDIHLDDPTADTSSGTVYVTRLEPKDFFGEIALIEENERRTANAVANSDVTLVGFFKPDLNELVERNPSTGIKVVSRLAEVLGRRLRETSKKITELKREMQKV